MHRRGRMEVQARSTGLMPRAARDVKRYVAIGALGGMLFAIFCVVIPPIVNPAKFMLDPGLVLMMVAGLTLMGGLFGYMTGMEGR